jgi:CelD/BcsL family acetyltransferase involved in cellulose biosynthesis
VRLGTDRTLEVETIEDALRFADLESEWKDLYQYCPLATPLQSWTWLYYWWENYGESYKLRIVTVWDDDLLVGIIPLMLEHQWDFDKLLFVGTGLPDNPDLFARGGWKDRVLAAAIQVLRHCSMDQERRGQILHLAGQPIS